MPEPLLGRRRTRVLANGVRQLTSRGLRPRRLPFPYTAPPIPGGVEPPERIERTGAGYETDWARTPAARAARAVVVETMLRPSVAALAMPERQGLDRVGTLDEDQNAIFAANHHSHLDTSLLLTSIPNPWRYRLVVGAAADYFFDNRVKAALSALGMGAFPIDRLGTGRSAADQAAQLIDDGNSLLIYPEGGRSPDGWGRTFKGGAAYLALRCDVPVVPVFLAGTGQVWRKGQRFPKPARTTVVFGDPLWAVDGESTRRLNARIEAAVSTLGDELATDWWQARRRYHQQGPPALTGPDAASWRRAWALGDRRRSRRSRTPDWPR